MQIITDLACELLRRTPYPDTGLTITTDKHAGIIMQTTKVTTRQAADAIGKPIGTYVNFDTTKARSRNIVQTLQLTLQQLLPRREKILVVGLGNDQFIADSLGPRVLGQIKTGPQLVTFEPCVCGVTGINSVQAIQAITKMVQPTAVIVIDSLVSATPARIGTNYQICNSGITPGSGIGRDNQTIDRKLLGVPVIAIGVPVCTIMTLPQNKIYHVVPKEIDMVIRNCANIIARSLNTLVLQNPYDATKP